MLSELYAELLLSIRGAEYDVKEMACGADEKQDPRRACDVAGRERFSSPDSVRAQSSLSWKNNTRGSQQRNKRSSTFRLSPRVVPVGTWFTVE